MFFAFIATSYSFVFASVRRFEKSKIWNRVGQQDMPIRKKHIIIAILTLLYAFCVSQFGLVVIVAKGWPTLRHLHHHDSPAPLRLEEDQGIRGQRRRSPDQVSALRK